MGRRRHHIGEFFSARESQRENLLNVHSTGSSLPPPPDPGADLSGQPLEGLQRQHCVPARLAGSSNRLLSLPMTMFLPKPVTGSISIYTLSASWRPKALPQALEPVDSGDTVRFTSYSANSMSVDANAARCGAS